MALLERQAATAAEASRKAISAEQGELVDRLVERIGAFYRERHRLRQEADEQATTEGKLRWRSLAEEQGWS